MPNGKWADPDVPKFGWWCDHVTDLEEPSAICEMCEVQVIRYVHHMWHPSGRRLNTGCVCAGDLEGDVERARNREAGARRQSGWLKRKWKPEANGGWSLNAEGYHFEIYWVEGWKWGWSITHREFGGKETSNVGVTMKEAKLAALERMLARKILVAQRIESKKRAEVATNIWAQHYWWKT